MVGDEWFENPTRLLRAELLVDDTARQAITVAAELIWDDLLDAVETDTVADALLLGWLPRQFRDRAVGDWRRWLATFTTVVYKLGQSAPPPAGDDGRAAVRRRAHRLHPEGRGRPRARRDGRPRRRRRRHRRGAVGRGVSGGRRPRAVVRPGVGRHRRRGHRPSVRVRADGLRGHVRRVQRTQRHRHRRAASAGVAAHDRPRVGRRTAPAARRRHCERRGGAGGGRWRARIHLTDDGMDVDLVAHRVGNLLDLGLRTAPTTIELVGPVDAATRDRLAGWLDHRNVSS